MSRTWTVLATVVALATRLPAADLDPYLPADTTAVVTVNVRPLADAALVKKHAVPPLEQVLAKHAEVQKLLETAKVDLPRDLDTITAALPGSDVNKLLVVVRGRFDLAEVDAALAAAAAKYPDAVKPRRDLGARVYEVRHDRTTAFAHFADTSTLLVSPSPERVTGARKGGLVRAELRTLAAGLDGRAALWLAALTPTELNQVLAKQPQTAALAGKIHGVNGTLHVGGDVQADLAVHTADARTAATVAELLGGFKEFALLLAGNAPQAGPLLADIVDAARISADGGTVRLRGTVTEPMIDKGLKAPPKGSP